MYVQNCTYRKIQKKYIIYIEVLVRKLNPAYKKICKI